MTTTFWKLLWSFIEYPSINLICISYAMDFFYRKSPKRSLIGLINLVSIKVSFKSHLISRSTELNNCNSTLISSLYPSARPSLAWWINCLIFFSIWIICLTWTSSSWTNIINQFSSSISSITRATIPKSRSLNKCYHPIRNVTIPFKCYHPMPKSYHPMKWGMSKIWNKNFNKMFSHSI